MSDQWYRLIDQKKYGPFGWSRIVELAARGKLRPEHLLQSGVGPWVPAGTMQGLFAPPAQTIAAPPVAAAVAPPVVQPAVIPAGQIPARPAIAPPPVPNSIPVGVPAGIPAGVPVGRTAPVPPAPSFAVAPAPVRGGSRKPTAADAEPADRSWLWFAGGGGFLALAIVGGILYSSGAFSEPATPVAAEAKSVAAPAAEPVVSAAVETAPKADEISAVKAEPAASGAERSPAKKADDDPAKLATEIAAISQWRDVSKSAGIKIGSVQFAIKEVWLAGDTSGAPLAGEGDDNAEKSRFLCVSLRIGNAAGAAPIQYSGWNDPATGAKLVSDDGTLISPQPLASAGGVPRVSATKIPAGETQIDTVVFELPPEAEPTKFRLAFPKGALITGQKGFFAYEVPNHVLAAPAQLAAVSGPKPMPQANAGNDAPAAKGPDMKGPAMKQAAKKPAGDGPIPIPGLGGGEKGDEELDPKEAEIQAKLEQLRMEREKKKEPGADEAMTPDAKKPEPEKTESGG